MGWELLVDSDRDMGVFICTTADESFGPLIKMHYCDAEGFYKWWNAHIGSDPRSMDSNERSDALSRFYGVQYDIKFVITAPDGTEISGDSSSMNYCRVKGLYDKGWTKEQFDLWDCNGWEKIMASIMEMEVPVLKDTAICLTYSNDTNKVEMERSQYPLLAHLRKACRNYDLHLEITVNEEIAKK